MSWQAYTDNLVATGKIDKAALYSRAGDSLWAQSGSFQLEPTEIAAIAKGFDVPDDLQVHGLHIQGKKYFLVRADERSIQGKFKDDQTDVGIIAVRTKQTILIAHYPTGIPGSAATVVVEKLADYLISVQY
ncbi:profilin, required for normal timing of actin polymerization in response to thermal stress [Scheffersomyces spartinae]|uniref:Profilin n=1 Tax=Scheffersomyces spartinae TaxID=45513 RepID=A0A9P7VF04_9ASCO|nr:profilin, required for normal timing of actin polymerization in response to thermal stress [Scheffersomyces spartinae]KAG7196223.1 profilin, required for normal timing of actin polymerization in response to thermal stress [Scheffersomyces spartinae]